MKRVLCAFIGLTFFGFSMAQSAPKVNERALREAMEMHLKDAPSARFKNIRQKKTEANTPGIWDICGEVNAKNSYGGYAGFETFVGATLKEGKDPVQYFVVRVGGVADQMCAQKFGN